MKKSKYTKIILLIIILVIAVFVVDLAFCLNRGYGFLRTTFRIDTELSNRSWRNMHPIIDYLEECHNRMPYSSEDPNAHMFPTAEVIAQNVSGIQLFHEQPYKNMGVWILENSAKKDTFLYTQASILENPMSVDDPNYFATVIMCDLAEREISIGIYRPYGKLPKFVIEKLKHEYWTCWTSLGVFAHFISNYPPVPGAVLMAELEVVGQSSEDYIKINNQSDIKCYYPESVVPVVKMIYPNLKIPENIILKGL
jgi:hypothetical protein